MWETHTQELGDGRCLHYLPTHHGKPISMGEALQCFEHDAHFRAFHIALLQNTPFPCYRWETPAVDADNLDRNFEFVLLDSSYLDVPANPRDFAEHFQRATAEEMVLRFPNLGADATLIVPTPQEGVPMNVYSHIGSFSRGAPADQQHALWQNVGATMQASITPSPLWLSTAGGGVDWLHVRLDRRPKYYGHAPYKERQAPA